MTPVTAKHSSACCWRDSVHSFSLPKLSWRGPESPQMWVGGNFSVVVFKHRSGKDHAGCPSHCVQVPETSAPLWPSGAGGWDEMGWTREEASAEGCSSGSPRGTGSRKQSVSSTVPRCHSPAMLTCPCSDPGRPLPAPGGLLPWSCVYSGALMGSWSPLKCHSTGTEPAQLMEKVGLQRVCGCSGKGGLHQG